MNTKERTTVHTSKMFVAVAVVEATVNAKGLVRIAEADWKAENNAIPRSSLGTKLHIARTETTGARAGVRGNAESEGEEEGRGEEKGSVWK